MGILDKDIDPVNARQVAHQLVKQSQSIFGKMLTTYNDGVSTFWENSNFTPQQISDALGTDAADLFRLHYILGQAIIQANSSAEIKDVNSIGTYTINQDSTVTATRNA